MVSLRKIALGLAAVSCMAVAADAAHAATRKIRVPATTMPWLTSGMLNRHNPFGSGDGTAPIAVSLASLHALQGGTVTVTYVSGRVSCGNMLPHADADGDLANLVNNEKGGVHGVFPSYYMAPYYPIYLGELVGTFVDRRGKIVGQPLRFGDGPTQFAIPANAKFLQFGVNDNVFADNVGRWTLAVSAP